MRIGRPGVWKVACPAAVVLSMGVPALSGPAFAVDQGLFFDPEDGMLDTSAYLSERRGSFLPVPIVITEPAVGFGLGMAAIFFHESVEQRARGTEGASAPVLPENISILGGGATDNGSWGGFAGHLGFWKEDTLRYRAGLGFGSFNLDFYTLGRFDLDRPVKLNVEGPAVFQEIKWRLGDSHWFAGARQIYRRVETAFERAEDASRPLPPAAQGYIDELFDRSIVTSSLGLMAEYDSRDSQFNPTRGQYYVAQLDVFDDAFGSDVDFEAFRIQGLQYWPLPNRFGIDLRFQYDGIEVGDEGRLPPYVLPFIDLRGIPKARYQGEAVGLVEIEGSWTWKNRWIFSLFGGVGRAADRFGDLDDAPSRTTRGVGFRYLVARRYGFVMGLDLAQGPEETSVYIQAGSTW